MSAYVELLESDRVMSSIGMSPIYMVAEGGPGGALGDLGCCQQFGLGCCGRDPDDPRGRGMGDVDPLAQHAANLQAQTSNGKLTPAQRASAKALLGRLRKAPGAPQPGFRQRVREAVGL